MFVRSLGVATLLAFGAITLDAQQPAVATGPSPLVTLRGTLRGLVTIQEKYYAANNRYADNLGALKQMGFELPPQVSVTLLETKNNAWSASASHADVAGATCVDWVGRPGEVAVPRTALDGRGGDEGVPTCDDAIGVVENRQIGEMSGGLRNLVTLQEKFWAEHGTYTTDLSALGLYPQPKGSRPSFLAQVIFAGGRGWTGIAVNHRLNKSCVLYIGIVDELPGIPHTVRDQLLPSREGEPVCEKP